MTRRPPRAVFRFFLTTLLAFVLVPSFGELTGPIAREGRGVFAIRPANAQGRTLRLNQKRARIEQLVKKIGEATERTILVPDDVRGTISIVAKRPVTLEEAWKILESSLSILGFALLPSTEGTWRIARVATAVGEAPFRLNVPGDRDSFVTTLIPLRIANIREVLSVLEPLSGSRITLVPYPETNSLIASGSERVIARLTDLAGELDRVEEVNLRLRVLRYRGVDDVEPLVEGFLEAGDRSLSRTQIWSDARTNSFVVRGEIAGVARVLEFLDRLDQPIDAGGAIRVLRVLHRDAEEMAELIRSFSDATISATSDAQASAGPLAGADFSIAVDGPTRSLIVRADSQTHKAIREVLEVLDAPVELVAVDITVSELRTPESYGFLFGFQIPFAKGSGTGDLLGFVQSAPEVGGAADFPTLTGRVQRSTDVIFQPPGAPIPIAIPIETSIGALDFDGTNEVLIQPSLIVTSGERHEIFVGDNVGIPVSDAGTGGESSQTIDGVNVSALSRTTSFERTDIGTGLAIEVRTGAEGKIQLDLEVEISAIDRTRAGLAGNPAEIGPSYTKKNLVVTARLDDGESAVLAVSKRQTETKIDSGIPFLRDLPYLGFLFGAKGTTVEDVRLMISARARRVSNPAELVADTIRRRLTFERRRARGAGMPAISGPPFAVRVTTRQLEEDAKAIADSIALRGFDTQVHSWELSGSEVFDVYVMHLSSMVDAAEVAEGLGEDGWDADLVVFPQAR